jgi:hypothetical protein
VSLTDLDANNVVDLDIGSGEFKQNAQRPMAEWVRRPPFYILSNGPPQVVCGRYAHVHEVFADTVRFSSELPRALASSSSTSSWGCSSSPRWMASDMRASAAY